MELVVNRPVVSTVLGHRTPVTMSLDIVTEGVNQAISWGNVTKVRTSGKAAKSQPSCCRFRLIFFYRKCDGL